MVPHGPYMYGYESIYDCTYERYDRKESWAPKNWCFWTVVLETTLESPLDCKEIQPVHPKGNSSWIFIGRTDAEAEALILWPPEGKIWLIGKDPTLSKRPWCWERLRARGEGPNRGRDGWMASLTQWTWIWVNSGTRWRTGKPDVLQFMKSQRVGHDLVTEQQYNCGSVSHSFMSNSLQTHQLYPSRLPFPWNFLGKNTRVDCHSFLQGNFPTQELNSGLLHCKQILYCLGLQGSPNCGRQLL